MAGGGRIALDKNLTLEIGYRHFETEALTYFAADSTENEIKIKHDTVMAGFRVGF
jgi:opacity protein-like surface antigen